MQPTARYEQQKSRWRSRRWISHWQPKMTMAMMAMMMTTTMMKMVIEKQKTTTSLGPDGSLKKMEEQKTRDPGETRGFRVLRSRAWRARGERMESCQITRERERAQTQHEYEYAGADGRSRGEERATRRSISIRRGTRERGTAFTAPNPPASYRPSAAPPGRKKKERAHLHLRERLGREIECGRY